MAAKTKNVEDKIQGKTLLSKLLSMREHVIACCNSLQHEEISSTSRLSSCWPKAKALCLHFAPSAAAATGASSGLRDWGLGVGLRATLFPHISGGVPGAGLDLADWGWEA